MLAVVTLWAVFEFLFWYVAVPMGLAYLGGRLLTGEMKQPETRPAEDAQSRSWSPHTTQREGLPRPRAWGQNLHHGNLVAKWTAVSDPANKVGFDGLNRQAGHIHGKYEVIVEFATTAPTVNSVAYHRQWRNTGGGTNFGGYEKVSLYYGGAWHLINTRNYAVKGEGTNTVTITAGGPWYDVTKAKIEAYLYNELTMYNPHVWLIHYLYSLQALGEGNYDYCWNGTADFNILAQNELTGWYTNVDCFNAEGGSESREILYLVVEHGDGPTKGVVKPITDSVFLNDQPATNFGSVTIQERVGTMGQTCMVGFEKTKLEYEIGNELVYDEAPVPILWTTPNDFFDDIEFTLAWLQGLIKYREDGSSTNWGVHVHVRIREHPAGEWSLILDQTVTAEQITPLFKLYRVNALVPGKVVRGKQYDLEFSRMQAKETRRVEDVCIKSVREVIDVAFTRPGKALVGIRAVATIQLSGSIDIKVVREDRLVWNGTENLIEYSRNRAWVTFDELTLPVIDDDLSIERYEGIHPSKIDLEFFNKWAAFCSVQVDDGYGAKEDRCACDLIVDYETDIWTLANEIARIGRAELYWQGHTLTGWIDALVTDGPVDLVTMDNVMAKTWHNAWAIAPELAGEVQVFFKNNRQGYERMYAPQFSENAGIYSRIISIEGIGITTRGTAIHAANFILERNRLIRNKNAFQQYKDAFRYRLGNVIRLQHRVPNWGQGYRVIKSETDDTVELDRVVEDVVAADLLYVRSFNETLQQVVTDVYTVQSVAGKVVTITETWDVTPLKGHLVAIGAAGAIRTRRIVKMTPRVDNYFDIEVETYDPTLYDCDDLVPSCPDKNYIWSQPARQLTQPVTRAEVVDIVSRLVPSSPNIDVPWLANCNWFGDEVDTVGWEARNKDEPITFRYRGETFGIEVSSAGYDDTTDEFIYWDPDAPEQFSHSGNASVALAPGRWLMCTNKAGFAFPANAVQLLHAAILQAGTITAELGQIGDLAVQTLKIANLAVTTPKIADNAVTKELAEYATNQVNIMTAGTTIGGPLTITTSGGDVKLTITCFYGATVDDEFWAFFKRDGNPIEPTTDGVWAEAAWGAFMCYTKIYRESVAAGTYQYSVKGYSEGDDILVRHRFFTVQEVKK